MPTRVGRFATLLGGCVALTGTMRCPQSGGLVLLIWTERQGSICLL